MFAPIFFTNIVAFLFVYNLGVGSASPKFLSRVSFHDTINSSIYGNLDYLCLDGSTVYAARKSQRFFVIDVADPANPQIKNIYSLRNMSSGISQSNGYLYIAERGGIGLPTGVKIFNLTNPNTPVESGFLTTNLNGLTTYKNSLYVFGFDSTKEKAAFEKYDISNPSDPVLKYLVDNNIGGIITVDIKVDKDYAYSQRQLPLDDRYFKYRYRKNCLFS